MGSARGLELHWLSSRRVADLISRINELLSVGGLSVDLILEWLVAYALVYVVTSIMWFIYSAIDKDRTESLGRLIFQITGENLFFTGTFFCTVLVIVFVFNFVRDYWLL